MLQPADMHRKTQHVHGTQTRRDNGAYRIVIIDVYALEQILSHCGRVRHASPSSVVGQINREEDVFHHTGIS